MKKILGCTTLAALMLTSSPLLALSDQEIEARFKQYEARIKALETDLKNQEQATSNQAAHTAAEVVPATPSASDSKLKINGFMTAGVTVAQEDVNNYGISETPNFRGLSKAGVQLSYPLNDRADATLQMVARTSDSGSDVWEVNAEWAYIGYRLNDDVKVRAGRMRIPFYMYSESLDVGYSYVWVRPPLDVYRSPITAYDGVDLSYTFRTAGFTNTLQMWTGSYADTSDGPAGIPDDIKLKDQYGVNLSSSWGDFTARVMAFTVAIDGTTTIDVNGGTPPIYLQLDAEDKLAYSSVGLQWDNGQFFVITETTDLRSEKGLFFTDEKAGYITAGTRIQDWTPYATYGWAYSANEGDFAGFIDGEPVCGGPQIVGGAADNKTCSSQSKNVSLGLRKELGANLALKAQWDHYYDFGGTNGNFGFAGYSSTGFPPTTDMGEGWNNADIYTITLDAVF